MIPISANVSPKIGRRVDSPSSRSSVDVLSRSKPSAKSQTNISIRNFVGALPTEPLTTSEAVVLGTAGDNVVDSLTQIQVPDSLKTSEFKRDEPPTDDIELRRFRQNQEVFDIVVDVRFLKQVIKTLIANHHITTTPHDLECILSLYGDVEVKTDKQVVQHRGIKKKKGVCSEVDADEVIEIVEKVLVNGINIVKKLPDFVQFLSSLGLNL
jgi:hypothetical protein